MHQRGWALGLSQTWQGRLARRVEGIDDIAEPLNQGSSAAGVGPLGRLCLGGADEMQVIQDEQGWQALQGLLHLHQAVHPTALPHCSSGSNRNRQMAQVSDRVAKPSDASCICSHMCQCCWQQLCVSPVHMNTGSRHSTASCTYESRRACMLKPWTQACADKAMQPGHSFCNPCQCQFLITPSPTA